MQFILTCPGFLLFYPKNKKPRTSALSPGLFGKNLAEWYDAIGKAFSVRFQSFLPNYQSALSTIFSPLR